MTHLGHHGRRCTLLLGKFQALSTDHQMKGWFASPAAKVNRFIVFSKVTPNR